MSLILSASQIKGYKPISLDEALNILMSGFLRGGAGFLKGTGEMIKGSSGVNREVRVGVTHVSIAHYILSKFAYMLIPRRIIHINIARFSDHQYQETEERTFLNSKMISYDCKWLPL